MEKTAKEGNWSQDASELSLCLSQAHLIANLGETSCIKHWERGIKGPRWRFTGQTIKEGVSANKQPDGQEWKLKPNDV